MGFGEVLCIDRMRVDPALTQALHSRWDAEATSFIFPWGHMIPSLEDVSWIMGLRLYGRPVSGFIYPCDQDVARRLLGLTESLGLYEVGKKVGEMVDGQLQRLTQGCQAVILEEPGAEADQDLRRFVILFLGRLLFATRGDTVDCRFLTLLEDLDEVGDYAWVGAFLAHQFDSLGASERQTSTSGFFPFLQVWAYLQLPVLRRGILERSGLVPIARRWDSRRDMHTLSDQLASLQDAIDSYPQLDVVWRPYLDEGDEGQPWLVQARPYFGRDRSGYVRVRWSFLVETGPRGPVGVSGDSTTPLTGASEPRSRSKTRSAEANDAYLQAFTLKYRATINKGVRRQVDVTGETASLQALLYSAMQDREIAQQEAEQLRKELKRVRRAAGAGASSSRTAEDSQSDLDDRLAALVRRAEEAQAELAERGQVDATTGERDWLRIWAEPAELLVVETMRELATLRVKGSSVDQTEMARLHTEIRIHKLWGLVTTLGHAAQSRSRSRTDVSGASGAFIRLYLAGSFNRRRNEEEERRRRGEASTQSGRGGGEMPPPLERQEGFGESGGGQ
ncbi:hypothetical protein Taro_020405 [Colocasia esculenta]|uniref:Aminotransferase-like plant mobile domain-containing protein n=1 Tax=Colocasia esculenta TaxID=4460 RepID=A0A843UNM8_COLES|nr:hypothetical protein [Colocasia esculenta]